MASPKVFISYSHDSDPHEDRVLELADRLRLDGVEAEIDQYEESPLEGWPAWCEQRINEANFVLLVCTSTYKHRVNHEEEPGRGAGVAWEAHLIRQHLYDAHGKTNKFVPVLFSDCSPDHIPTPVKGAAHYVVDDKRQYERLLRLLTSQPGVLKPKVGPLKPLPPRERRSRAVESAPRVPEQRPPMQNKELPITGTHHWMVVAAICLLVTLLFLRDITLIVVSILLISVLFALPSMFRTSTAARTDDQGGLFLLTDLVAGLLRYGAIVWITGAVLIHVSPNVLQNSLESAYNNFIEEERKSNHVVPAKILRDKDLNGSYLVYVTSSDVEMGRFSSGIRYFWKNCKPAAYLEAAGAIGFIMGFMIFVVEQLAIFIYRLRT